MQANIKNLSFKAQRRIAAQGMFRMPTASFGFTLVELAIALMIIGLLIGGVLKGQELVENARITQTIRQISAYDTAVQIFRNTYNAVPGDFNKPNRIPNCTEAPCSNSGNADGLVSVSALPESLTSWFHLERAGLISMIDNSATDYRRVSPEAPFGVNHHVILRRINTSHIEPSGLPPYNRINDNHWELYGKNFSSLDIIRRLDQKMDDGKPFGGRMTLYTTASGDVCYDEDTWDYLMDETLACKVKIHAETAN